ncbi:MAG: hypothetical protein Q8K70_02440 [Bacteroidota bacterium]|nr:hypothetical protein [Bacteroidota bacterium]
MLIFKKHKVIQAISILLVVFGIPRYTIAKTPKKYYGIYSGTYSDSIYTSTITLNLKNDGLYSCNISVKNIKTRECYKLNGGDMFDSFPVIFQGKYYIKMGYLYLYIDSSNKIGKCDTICQLQDSSYLALCPLGVNFFMYNFKKNTNSFNPFYKNKKVYSIEKFLYTYDETYYRYKIEKFGKKRYGFNLRLSPDRVENIWTGNSTYIIKQ